MKRHKVLLLILIMPIANSMIWSQAIPVPSTDILPKHYICYRAVDPIIIDGRIDESIWGKAEWTDNFVDIEGTKKPVPRFKTRVKILWDDNYFYFAAELAESDIWAKLKNHDDIIFYDNDFEIFIDPDGDTHNYCELEINAFNTYWDLFLIKAYRDIKKAALHDWNIKGLKTAVSVQGTLNDPADTDTSWTVEIAYPWSAFREIADVKLPPRDYDQWRVNFSRVEWRTIAVNGVYEKIVNPETDKTFPEDNWVWSPQGVINMHYPEMWGYVQFSTMPVGDTSIEFKMDPRENAKKLLRRIYYSQKIYRAKHGKYAESFTDLNITYSPLPGYSSLPEIRCTFDSYEARLVADDNSNTVFIRSDGLTWIQKN